MVLTTACRNKTHRQSRMSPWSRPPVTAFTRIAAMRYAKCDCENQRSLCECGSGRFYFDINGGGTILWMPDYNFFAERGEGGPFNRNSNLNTADNATPGFAVGGSIGMICRRSLLGACQTRLETRYSYLDAQTSTNSAFLDPGAGTRFGWEAFDTAGGFGTNDGNTLTTRVDRDVALHSLDLLLHQDYQLYGQNRLTLYAGASLRRLEQDFDVFGQISTSVTMRESLNTDYYGGKLGMSTRRPVRAGWMFEGDCGIGLYGASSDYVGNYADSTPSDISRTRSSSDFAVNPYATLKLTKPIRPNAFISGYTTAEYLNYVPQMEYGELGTPPSAGSVRMDGDEMTSLVLGLNLTFVR